MKVLKTLYRVSAPTSWIARLAILSSMLLLFSCVPPGKDTKTDSDTSESCKEKDDDDASKDAKWSCTNPGGHIFYSKTSATCAQYYPQCKGVAHPPESCEDPDLKEKKTCTTSTVTSTATSTSTSTSTSTAAYSFPALPGRTCTVDRFQQSDSTQVVKKVDILFVMDHSGSMDRHWNDIAQNIESMVKQLPSTTDIRYAVLLADVGTWSGRLYTPFGVAYLDNQKLTTAQIAAALQKTFAAGMKINDSGSGEAAMYSLTQAVTVRAHENQNAGFFRPDAGLSVLFMSDENDIGVTAPKVAGIPVKCDATFEAGVKKSYYDNNGISVTSTFNALKALKGDMPVKTHAFVNITKQDLFTDNDPSARCLYDMIGYGYVDIVNASKGVLFSIQQDKAQGLAQCGQMIKESLALKHDFNLSKPANKVDPATILSAVDAALVPFTYSAASDSVHLDDAGQANSIIQIRHCEPDGRVNWNLTGFSGTPSQTSVGLSWQTAEYATGGKVFWGTSAASLTNQVDDVNTATNHGVTVSGLSPNSVYYFQAVSFDEFGQVKASSVLSFRTHPDWTISAVASQAARSSASLEWSTSEYATKGHVLWGTSANALANQSADTATVNSHQVDLSGLLPSATYYFQCVSSDEFGLTRNSDVLSFTTQADWGISGLAGQATRSTVALAWSTLDQVTTGKVLWGTSAASLTNQVNEGAAAAITHAVTVTGLIPDTDYYFQALATDGNGQVKNSNVILVHTAVDWNVSGFAGTSTQTSVSLAWSTPGYATDGHVFWGTADTALTNVVADTVTGMNHGATVSGLNADTVYYFQAASIDSDGIEKRSAVVAIRTQAVPLPTWSISGFAGTSTTNSVALGWNTTQYATSGYVVWGDSLATMTSQANDATTGTSHAVNVTGLAADTIYFFQAVSTDDRGQTQMSDIIQVRTMADVVTPPANWVIVGFDGTTTSTQANLIWQTPGAPTRATVKVGASANDLTLMSLDIAIPADVQQLAVPGLVPSTTYFFQVVATDSAGRTVESVIITKTTKAP